MTAKLFLPVNLIIFYAGQFQFVHLLGKFAVFVVPEDDAAFIKFRQRCVKPLREPKFYRF